MLPGRFETLLWDFSAALSALGPSELEAELGSWLGRIAEAMGLDRASIWQFVNDTDHVRLFHIYPRIGGGTSVVVSWDATRIPWFAEQLASRQRIFWTGLPDALPAAAAIEREHFRREGYKSLLGIPLLIGGELLGTLILASCDPATLWSDTLIQQLELLGQVFASELHRKQVEAALRVSEERLRRALDAATMGTWEWDGAADQIVWSKHIAPMFGLQEGEFGATYGAYMALVHPEDRKFVWRTFRDSVRGKSPSFTIEHRTIWPDGSVHWLELRGKVLLDDKGASVNTLGTIVDISERKQIEQALRESEEQFRLMFAEAPIGIVYVTVGLRFEKVNRAMCEFLGYSAAELTQLSIADITHPDEVEASLRRMDRLFAGELRIHQVEKRYLKKSGEVTWVLLTVTPIFDKSGNAVSALAIVENISARKQLEDQFRQAQKMDAFGQLAAGVAHDFNNLLTAINGYSELSLDQLSPDHFLRSNLQEIIKAGERAAALTRQLLAFSRKQVLRPKVIDLRFVIEDMNKLLRRLIGEDIRLQTKVQPDLGKVLCDPGQIEQIVINLAVNARDAMPLGGQLTIELVNVALQEELRGHLVPVPSGRYVVLKVSDTGSGMSDAVKARIFEPFFSTKEPGRSTGLGLSTVYGIVSQSGGHILVTSEPAVGTRFEIYLPEVDALASKTFAPADSGIDWKDTPGGTETILLVEDDDSVRNMVQLILRDCGYDVLTAGDGRAARLLAESTNRKIGLLLTDVVMPKMSGRELADALMRGQPALKVIYMSGYAGDAIAHHGVLAEGVVLIEKPFTMDELLRRVRAVLDEP